MLSPDRGRRHNVSILRSFRFGQVTSYSYSRIIVVPLKNSCPPPGTMFHKVEIEMCVDIPAWFSCVPANEILFRLLSVGTIVLTVPKVAMMTGRQWLHTDRAGISL